MYNLNQKHADFDLHKKDDQSIIELGKALSCQTRIDILRLVSRAPMTITELAHKLYISTSAVLFHVELLENAKLVKTDLFLSHKKYTRLINSYFRTFSLSFVPANQSQKTAPKTLKYEIPIGMYTDAHFSNRFGIVLDNYTFVKEIFSPERIGAYILWCDSGWVEYDFPCDFFSDHFVQEISFSLEICSEAPFYRNDWKSDVSFFINGKELATYTCPADFGGRRGRLNPSWWSDDFTQYGQLIKISVTANGCYLNGVKSSDTSLYDLFSKSTNRFRFRIENKETATHRGGFNLFSKHFGEYEQDIIMTVLCEQKQFG